MKTISGSFCVGALMLLAHVALADGTVGAPNNAFNNQPGQIINEGANMLPYSPLEGDLVLLENGDPLRPDLWDRTSTNWSDVVRFYNVGNNGRAFMVDGGVNGIDVTTLPALGNLPAGQLAGTVDYILESQNAATDYRAVNPNTNSFASFSIFSPPPAATTPEPGTLALFLSGGLSLGLFGYRYARRRA